MAKQVIGNLKLRIPGGKATAGPPVGSTLGQWGLNMMDFINPFNEATKEYMGKNVIVHIAVYDDRTFDWKCLGQPVDDLIREKIKLEKGSGRPNTEKVGKITMAQIKISLTLSTKLALARLLLAPHARWASKLSSKTPQLAPLDNRGVFCYNMTI